MPFLLLIGLLGTSAALAFKVVADETEETATTLVRETGPNLLMLGAAGLGLWMVWREMSRK